MTTNVEVIQHYKAKIDDLSKELKQLQLKSKRLSFGRLLIALAGLILIFVVGQISVLLTIGVALITLIAFVMTVRKHDKVDQSLKEVKTLIRINENEIHALLQFENEYYNGAAFAHQGHFYTTDLDVFGVFSLYGVINRCRSYHGNQILNNWFSEPDQFSTILERTEAVKELEKMEEWRQHFAAGLYELKEKHNVNFAQEVTKELNANLNFTKGRGLRLYRKLVPILWIGIVSLGFWDSLIASRLAITLGLLNVAIAMKFMNPIAQIQDKLSKSGLLLERFSRSLHCIMNGDWKSSMLKSEVSAFVSNSSDPDHPVKILGELKKIIDQLDYRLNIIAAFLLNAVVLWDLIIMDRLASWQERNLSKIESIFKLIGLFEAVSSLSTWAANHPQYVYASLVKDHFHLEGKGFRHPLIHEFQSVSNDFEIEEPRKINIVTGSNMSGKSTFLRTIGTNMVLGFLGTKVAAEHLSSSVVQLMSYMRIKDALEENVSTFKAELNRVELMLSLVNSDAHCLILIDEMLRGTNSKDKLKGSINITKRLIDQGAYALIATHDIKLAELANEFPEAICNYYFDIDFEDGDLKFDYKLKKGICENFNASFLLKQIGIG
ncbi:MAG: hypothetical protein KJP00_02325 [Bacteroidia bacterium]|nr:hypothetical protein [Bacteroidia bacterium]